MRSPEGHEETVVTEETKTEETKTEEKPSLINEETKTEETKTEETKTEEKKEETKTEEVKVEPITVESLTIPEGFELPEEMGKEFTEILNGDMEPKDRANALIALHAKTMTQALEADSKAWDTMQETWKGEVKADPEVGGEKLQSTLTNIGKLVSEFGTDELKGVFDSTGAGNNVHVIKFLNTIATKLTEGNFFTAGKPTVDNTPDAAAKRMFPSMKG